MNFAKLKDGVKYRVVSGENDTFLKDDIVVKNNKNVYTSNARTLNGGKLAA